MPRLVSHLSPCPDAAALPAQGLPKSFLNRFTRVAVEAMSFDDLVTVRCPALDRGPSQGFLGLGGGAKSEAPMRISERARFSLPFAVPEPQRFRLPIRGTRGLEICCGQLFLGCLRRFRGTTYLSGGFQFQGQGGASGGSARARQLSPEPSADRLPRGSAPRFSAPQPKPGHCVRTSPGPN